MVTAPLNCPTPALLMCTDDQVWTVCRVSLWELSAQTQVFKKVVLLLLQMAMLLKLQESANYIESPEREGCLDPTLQATLWCDRRILALSQLTQGVQSQQDFKNSIIKSVCSVSSYKANCKESTDRGIMDQGFSLPCYLNFRKTMKLLSQ